MSENAQRSGFLHSARAFHARRFAGMEGSSGRVGTWLGIARGPILYEGSGNGASYAATSSGEIVRPSILPMIIIPTGRSWVSHVHFCQWAKAISGRLESGLERAAITSGSVGVGLFCRKSITASIRSWAMGPGVGKPVFASTILEKRSGFSATRRRPISRPHLARRRSLPGFHSA
jgi:hypothetical protein